VNSFYSLEEYFSYNEDFVLLLAQWPVIYFTLYYCVVVGKWHASKHMLVVAYCIYLICFYAIDVTHIMVITFLLTWLMYIHMSANDVR
jgi:hypothetical protein